MNFRWLLTSHTQAAYSESGRTVSTTSGIADAVRAVLASARHPRALSNIYQPSQGCSYQTKNAWEGWCQDAAEQDSPAKKRDIEIEKEGFITSSTAI